MYSPPRSLGPPPNYTIRRLVALTAVVVVLLVVWMVAQALVGGDEAEPRLSAGSSTSSAPTSIMTLTAPPPCAYEDEPTIYSLESDWARTVLDPIYAIPEDYQPPDLVSTAEANYSAEYQIRSFVTEDLNQLRNAILREGIPEVAILAGYRSIADQAALFSTRESSMGFEAAAAGTARPGHSEHHLGTAIDFRPIGETDVDESFGDTPTGMWLDEHSWEYGFVLPYPRGAEDVTCYKYEPWHFRYVGKDLACRVEIAAVTLREYLWHWEVNGSPPPIGADQEAQCGSLAAPTSTTAAVADGDGEGGG